MCIRLKLREKNARYRCAFCVFIVFNFLRWVRIFSVAFRFARPFDLLNRFVFSFMSTLNSRLYIWNEKIYFGHCSNLRAEWSDAFGWCVVVRAYIGMFFFCFYFVPMVLINRWINNTSTLNPRMRNNSLFKFWWIGACSHWFVQHLKSPHLSLALAVGYIYWTFN